MFKNLSLHFHLNIRSIFVLTFILVAINTYAQPSHLKGLDKHEIASYYINYLKKGSLLVRLQTKERKIEILKKAGNIAAAEKVRKDQEKVNLSIIKAFREKFSFCPVYFFFSSDSKYIMQDEVHKVRFLDDKLIPNASIKAPQNFLTAEFSIIKEDTAQNQGGTRYVYYERDSTGAIKEVPYYSGGTNMSFGALIIKSNQFIQLSKPFPYYMRTLATLPMLRRSHAKVVEMMNTQLEEFWLRNQ